MDGEKRRGIEELPPPTVASPGLMMAQALLLFAGWMPIHLLPDPEDV
jgi:hypothetical protein